jgi:hypothetical protein
MRDWRTDYLNPGKRCGCDFVLAGYLADFRREFRNEL